MGHLKLVALVALLAVATPAGAKPPKDERELVALLIQQNLDDSLLTPVPPSKAKVRRIYGARTASTTTQTIAPEKPGQPPTLVTTIYLFDFDFARQRKTKHEDVPSPHDVPNSPLGPTLFINHRVTGKRISVSASLNSLNTGAEPVKTDTAVQLVEGYQLVPEAYDHPHGWHFTSVSFFCSTAKVIRSGSYSTDLPTINSFNIYNATGGDVLGRNAYVTSPEVRIVLPSLYRPVKDRFDKYYPERASRMEKSATLELSCERMDRQLKTCKVIRGDRPGFQFEENALKVVSQFRLVPEDSRAAQPQIVPVVVAFDRRQRQGVCNRAPANGTAPPDGVIPLNERRLED